MTTKNNGKIKDAEFKAKVITHLEYIKKEQTDQKGTLKDLNDKLDKKMDDVNDRMGDVEKDIDTAKGFAKGAAVMGGTGIVTSVISFITRYIPK